MTEEKKKPAGQKKPAAAAPKADVSGEARSAKTEKPKAAAKPVAEKKAAPQKARKAAPTGKTVTVLQTGSAIGRQGKQQATLIGLGLNKRNRTRTLQDTPEVRGMIYKVRHLVKVVG